jgi:hypothetical protein
MAATWEHWETMRASLEYCCTRISELENAGSEARPELEELLEYGMTTAARLLYLPDAPPLSTAAFREQWQTGCAAVLKMRERISLSGLSSYEA